MTRNDAFLKMLVSNRILAREDAEKLVVKHAYDAFAILTYLLAGGAAKKDDLGKMWGDSLGVAYVNLDKTLFQDKIVQKLPASFAATNKIIPLYQFGETVTVAMAEPGNTDVKRDAAQHLGCPVNAVFALPDDITYAIEVYYQSLTDLDKLIGKLANNILFKGTSKITEEQLKGIAGDQSIVELAKGIMILALKERASDIHIDPGEDLVRIRYRIDGVLHDRLKLDKNIHAPLVSRIKIIASMDISERRKPQDGRISLALTSRSIDFRLSTVPTIYGEKVVLRILGQIRAKEVPDLTELNLSGTNLGTLRKIIDTPNGVFFVTGPTGSGKTTTLYSVLKHINKDGVNIMTIEDPVEYRMAGINQIQVNHAISMDFSTALRSFLRQDPDVILVGEIRDAETAKIASQAALTGHLVLTTMHTNNALQAVTRLVEIGVEPFLVAPSIIGVMAQRLVRKICEHCKEKYVPEAETVDRLFEHDGTTDIWFYRGKGCEECHDTGYFGRLAIHELLIIDDTQRRMITRDASIVEIQEYAMKSGFQTMHYDGIKKVLKGLTTLEEVEKAAVSAA